MEKQCKELSESSIKKILGAIAELIDDNHYDVNIKDLLSSKVAQIKLRSFPLNISLMIVDNPGFFFIGGENRGVWVCRIKAIPFEDWHHLYSAQTYGTKMAEILQTWTSEYELKDISTDDDGENFDVEYSLKFDGSISIKDIITFVRNFEKELIGHTEMALSKNCIDKQVLRHEDKFSLNVLLPLFRSMGYQNVQYNHGPREFGRDIIFTDLDKLGITRNFGVQVKAGDMTGKAGSQLDTLIAQIDDALGMTYADIYSQERRQLTDLIIAISGRFTGNAPQKICEKTDNKNVHFLGIDKIQELMTKYLNINIE